MILNATDITRWQTCRRRFLLEHYWRVLRWHPQSLFSSCLRDGAFRLSAGIPVESVIQHVRTRYMSQASDPGLELITGDPYQIASDHCAILSTVLTTLSRLTLLTLQQPLPVEISPELTWQPLAFQDEAGSLHRWIAVDAWDADAIAREVHSWYTFADMVMCEAPMQLHVAVIGQRRDGRMHTPWCKGYQHPVAGRPIRFRRKISSGGRGGWGKLEGEAWRSVWLSDLEMSPTDWVDLMEADGLTHSLLLHPAIAQASEESAHRARQQIRRVAREIHNHLQAAAEYREPEKAAMDQPMARAACDLNHRACPWQQACYREIPEEGIGELGLYQIRAAVPAASGLAGSGPPPVSVLATPATP